MGMSFLIFCVGWFEVCAGGAHWCRLFYFIFADIIAFEFLTAFLIVACPFSTILGFSYCALPPAVDVACGGDWDLGWVTELVVLQPIML